MITVHEVRMTYPVTSCWCSDNEIKRAIENSWCDEDLKLELEWYAERHRREEEQCANWEAEDQARYDCEYE